MKVRTEILEQRHIENLAARLQDKQAHLAWTFLNDRSQLALMRQSGPCAAFVVNGDVMACAGLIDYPGTNRCVIWAMFANDVKSVFAALYKKMYRSMCFYPRRRYEAYIDPAWKNARRFAALAGFECEGLMRSFENDGSDKELWALIRKEGF